MDVRWARDWRRQLEPTPLRPGEADFVRTVSPRLGQVGLLGAVLFLPAFAASTGLYWFLVCIWCFGFGLATFVYVFRIGYELWEPGTQWWRSAVALGAINWAASLFTFGLLLASGCFGFQGMPWDCTA